MKKLITGYEDKILKCDKVIESCLLEITIIRREGKSAMTHDEWSNLKKVVDTQRQCYIQFIRDLEDYA